MTRLQASEEQLNATRVELTLIKEEVKQAKDELLGLNPALEALTLRFFLLPCPSSPFKDSCVVHTMWYLNLSSLDGYASVLATHLKLGFDYGVCCGFELVDGCHWQVQPQISSLN